MLLLVTIDSYAQSNRYAFGIEGGMNRSHFMVNDNSSTTSSVSSTRYSGNTGASVGMNFQWNAKKLFSLKTGISFDRKAFTIKRKKSDALTGSSSKSRETNSYDYVTIPLTGKFTFGKKVQFFVNAGIYWAYLVHQNQSLDGNSSYIQGGNPYYSEYTSNKNNIDAYKHSDFGLIGGLGLGVPIKKHWYISLETREVIGLVDIRKTTSYTDRATRTATFNVLLGLSYRLEFREEKNN